MTSLLRTPLCDALEIDHPIFSVGFGVSAGPELVAAVSKAGGCGVLGGSGIPPDHLRERIVRTRELTGRSFGVNLIVADFEHPESTDEDRAFVLEQVEAIADAGVPLLVLIAQGIEAGGHVRGTTPIWELLPATVTAVGPVPVLASGGIGDGAGVVRALRAGAQGVSLGTRFVASDEALVHPVYKRRVVESRAEDTFYGLLFDVWWPDAPHRVLKNKTFQEWDAAGRPPSGERPGEGTPIGTLHRPWREFELPRYATGMATPDFDGDLEYAPLWAGESCSVVNDIKPAAAIVRDLVREAEAALASPAVS